LRVCGQLWHFLADTTVQVIVFYGCFFSSQEFRQAVKHLSPKDPRAYALSPKDPQQQHAFLSLLLRRSSLKKVPF